MKQIETLLENKYDMAIQDIQPMHAGNTTDKYRVMTDTNTFVLRIRSAGFNRRALSADHRFMSYLHEHNVPVPRIIRTMDDGTFVEDDGALYELQSAIPHDGNLGDFEFPSVANDLFDVLGAFHRVSSTYPETIEKPPYLGDSLIPIGPAEKYFYGPQQYGVPRYLAERDNLMRAQRAQFERDIRRFQAYLDTVYAAYQRRRMVFPMLINHNDFYGNNVLFYNGSISGIVDFDFCRSGLYVIDLIEALHGSMVWHSEAARYLGITEKGDIRVDLARENLRRYFNHNPDFAYDGEFIIKFLIAKIISLAWYPAIDFFPTIDEKLEGFRRMKAVIRRLEEVHEIRL
ncbi:MAG: phosphotransferase enzyme family protein [Anaerolineales bacterium]